MSGAKDVITAARAWRGTPYVHQASAKGAGCDCLGLVRGVWRDVIGQEPCAIPAYSFDWSEASGQEQLWAAALDHLRPIEDPEARLSGGQVLLFRMREGKVAKHLGICTAAGEQAQFIHAYYGRGVVEVPLSTAWRRRIVARFEFPI